jgi:hypothetical protein
MPGQFQNARRSRLEHGNLYANPQANVVEMSHCFGTAQNVNDLGRLAGTKQLNWDGVGAKHGGPAY